ncbi:unnamed protein product [Cunninghamella echinulata]
MDYQKTVDIITKTFSDKAQLEKAGKIAAISLATYIVTQKIYTAYFGPLSKIPSSTYARFFEIPNPLLINQWVQVLKA